MLHDELRERAEWGAGRLERSRQMLDGEELKKALSPVHEWVSSPSRHVLGLRLGAGGEIREARLVEASLDFHGGEFA
jgi:hypothetical protein